MNEIDTSGVFSITIPWQDHAEMGESDLQKMADALWKEYRESFDLLPVTTRDVLKATLSRLHGAILAGWEAEEKERQLFARLRQVGR
jgi:FMN-dependent NADH-azoreductase